MVDWVCGLFGLIFGGVLGNDDFGVLFSWYVWVVFGLYLSILGIIILIVNILFFDCVVIVFFIGKFI